MKFVPVDPKDMPNFREGRRGRVSYPLLKSFLETNLPIAMLDRTGMQNSLQALMSSLGAYIRNHELPIKMVTRSGQIYLIRTDVGEDGNPVPFDGNMNRRNDDDAKPTYGLGSLQDMEPLPITSDVVQQRFQEERGKVSK
jgi:hypothetical protein